MWRYPQPTIAEVKQAWIEEAQDVMGLHGLKKVLGSTYESLAPGSEAEGLRVEGLRAIQDWQAA